MKHYERKTVVVETVKDIICNACGAVIGVNEYGVRQEHLSIEKRWGFGSAFDGEIHNIDICMPCYEKWLAGMKIPARDS